MSERGSIGLVARGERPTQINLLQWNMQYNSGVGQIIDHIAQIQAHSPV